MQMENVQKIVAIVGPTATGKTGLGVAIAKKYDGEIVSADSRQVFRGLDIGTGKDLSEYGNIKYHLIDICDPGEEFSMFDWLSRAREVIEGIFARGKLPVIVGGTGLYVQALIEGFEIKDHPSRPRLEPRSEESRIKNQAKISREQLNSMSLEELQKIYYGLRTNDHGLDVQNPRRLIRAIEKAQEGTAPTKIKPDFVVLQIAIDYPREELYSRIDKRVDEWFAEGFYEEVSNLMEKGVSLSWFEKIGLEYKILANYIDKDQKDFEVIKQNMKWKIHQYARRQLTWFRRFSEIIWAKNKNDVFGVIDDFLKE
ncbi:MAG: tRNA (adenosine(37)-N6)-dimethylallyltransferase MiaA [Patescibacteria group bacterium]